MQKLETFLTLAGKAALIFLIGAIALSLLNITAGEAITNWTVGLLQVLAVAGAASAGIWAQDRHSRKQDEKRANQIATVLYRRVHYCRIGALGLQAGLHNLQNALSVGARPDRYLDDISSNLRRLPLAELEPSDYGMLDALVIAWCDQSRMWVEDLQNIIVSNRFREDLRHARRVANYTVALLSQTMLSIKQHHQIPSRPDKLDRELAEELKYRNSQL